MRRRRGLVASAARWLLGGTAVFGVVVFCVRDLSAPQLPEHSAPFTCPDAPPTTAADAATAGSAVTIILGADRPPVPTATMRQGERLTVLALHHTMRPDPAWADDPAVLHRESTRRRRHGDDVPRRHTGDHPGPGRGNTVRRPQRVTAHRGRHGALAEGVAPHVAGCRRAGVGVRVPGQERCQAAQRGEGQLSSGPIRPAVNQRRG
jgi:hypothetical protein